MQMWKRRTIGILAIAGGCVGILSIALKFPTLPHPSDWAICGGFAALYAWGIYCGTKLLEGHRNAVRANLAFWLAQVPAFTSPLVSYRFDCGFRLTAGVQLAPSTFGVDFMFGSSFVFTMFQSVKTIFFGLNLFALAVALILAQQLRRAGAASA